MKLTEFNQELIGRLTVFLWRQWIQIGVRASYEDKTRDGWIIDPEALWLLTTSMGRYDARLFDEAMDWISTNAAFMNMPRLKSLLKQYGFESTPVLAAISETVCQKNSRLKWAFHTPQIPDPPEVLFLSQPAGTAIKDSVFEKYGLIRGPVQLRDMSRRFNYAMPECALLRLRSLVGLNARAEIYAYLCTHRAGHPSGIAKETGYSQKNIQDTMVDMSAAHIVIAGELRGRKKKYQIAPSNWQTLLHDPKSPPIWMTWPPIFRALEILWKECRTLETKDVSSLLLSGRLRELSERLRPLLEQEEGSRVFRPYSLSSEKPYADIFFEDILNWLATVLKV
jgi:hypothetical protein